MICRNDIVDLKSDISQKIGQKVIIKGSLGRSKIYEQEAIIDKTYPNTFNVKFGDEIKNLPSSFSYIDVLTRTVEVSIFNGENYSPLVPYVEEKKRKKSI